MGEAKFTVGREDLQRTLALCGSVIERRSTIPILQSVLLTATTDKVTVGATDLETTVVAAFPAQVEAEGALVADHAKLAGLTKLSEGDSVTLSRRENGRLKIETGTGVFEATTYPADDFPLLPSVIDQEGWRAEEVRTFTLPAGALASMLAVIYATDAHETRIHAGPWLHFGRKGIVESVATDGHRMAIVSTGIQGIVTGADVAILNRSAVAIARMVGSLSEESEVSLTVGANHLRVSHADQQIYAKLVSIHLPKHREHIPSLKHQGLVAKDRFQAVVRRVLVLAAERTSCIKVDFEPGVMHISTSNQDGAATESLAFDYSGPAVDVSLNAQYLTQAIAATPSERIAIKFESRDRAVTLTPDAETGSLEHLAIVMPMRTQP